MARCGWRRSSSFRLTASTMRMCRSLWEHLELYEAECLELLERAKELLASESRR